MYSVRIACQTFSTDILTAVGQHVSCEDPHALVVAPQIICDSEHSGAHDRGLHLSYKESKTYSAPVSNSMNYEDDVTRGNTL